MNKNHINGIEGLKAILNKDLEPGSWHTMRFEHIMQFADLTGDHQWVHVDKARIAKESPFKVPIAHGLLSVAMIGGLFTEAVEISGFQMIVNYGFNKVRFPTALKEGAEYRLKVRLDSITPLEKGIEVVFSNTIEVKGESKPACVAECVCRLN